MKKAIKLTLAVVLVMGATSLFAQKFGRINTQEIIMAMPETKTMQENMDTFAKELSDNIETMNVEFNTKLQDFQNNYNTFSDAIKEVKEKELNDMQTRTREFQERAQQDYQKKQNELLAPIIDKAKSAIDKVAAAGGFLVVFDTSTGSLAYFDEATLTDVAPAVKKELGITDGQTTEDGLFTLNNVACLGCCSLAPVMMIRTADGDETYGNLTKAKVRAILQDIRAKEAASK